MNSVAELIGKDPGWLTTVKGVLVFALCVVATLITILAERKVVSWMQMRVGPNRTGWKGSLQSLADGVKLALKEDLIPKAADRIVFVIAPVISVTTCFMAFAVIPMSGKVKLFGHTTVMQLTDIPVGVLYVLAAASVGVYGIVLAGWSSGSTYPLLGGLRSSAQVISYEVAMGLSLVAVFIYSGSMSTADIVSAQNKWWFAVTLFPSFVIYTISMVGETNRAPFDLAEAEGELVGGFHTEYSSLKFALFFLGEYINIATVSALATTLFFGGYHALPGLGFTNAWLGGWFGMVWFFAKVCFFFNIFVWVRATLPRIRYDQFMKFGWKVLIPSSLIWIIVVATLRALSANGASRFVIAGFAGGVVLVIMALSSAWDKAKEKAKIQPEFDVAAPSFPVPKMPTSKEVN
mgnify:CR=1 FL=1